VIGDATLHFHVGYYDAACDLIVAHHYSHRVPSNIQIVGTLHEAGGLFGDRGEAMAACLFSIPPTRWSVDVWELCRLVRRPDCTAQLTWLIARTAKYAASRPECPGLLVSFADATQGHHGGIYQAASWNYGGQRERRMDGLIVDGGFVPGRVCNHKWGTRSPTKLSEMFREKVIEPHFDEGKHLYWRAMNKAGRKAALALGLSALPYPKPKQEAML
jgi:hypothetical protein